MFKHLAKIVLACLLLTLPTVLLAEDACRVPTRSIAHPVSELLEQMDTLLDQVRDGVVSRESAKLGLQRLLPLLAEQYRFAGGKRFQKVSWVFPLAGYGPQAVAGRKGKGFVVKGYDFFTGNRHGGHPAYDIFIRDKDRDSLDDRSRKPVGVLSMTGGVVISTETEWYPESGLRGGKYIWVYDPTYNLLVYYAHNSEVLVKQGDIVQPGDKLATVGRTGKNAAKKRSPTHLHMTVLQADQGNPKAVRFWDDLLHSKTMYCE